MNFLQNYELFWNSVLILLLSTAKIPAMVKRIFFQFIFLLPCFIFISCSRTSAPAQTSVAANPGPACYVYKTKADYSKYVPVILSADKSHIMSFPDIRDIYYQGRFACPDTLSEGYLLDNRGIGPDVAFLSYTYEAYSRLDKTPSSDDLMKNILDNDPLLEMYQCGKRNQYTEPVKSLNEIIARGGLKDCKRLK